MIEPEKVAAHLDLLAKPKGSLGRLEDLAVRLGSIQGTLAPETKPRRLLVFAGDHGVVNDGVGIWPQAVTGAMIGVIAAGRASCSALAAAFDVSVTLVDVGSAVSETPGGEVLSGPARRSGHCKSGARACDDAGSILESMDGRTGGRGGRAGGWGACARAR